MKSQYDNSPPAASNTSRKPSRPIPNDEVIDQAWQEFQTFLRQRGDRVTEARHIVLSESLRRNDHFRADDLAAVLAQGADRVSRGTVYRTLSLLVQAGLVREIRDGDTHVHYEGVVGREHHEHMICDHCGEFIEFYDDHLNEHIQQACDQNHFRQRTHRVVIFGTCPNCQNRK